MVAAMQQDAVTMLQKYFGGCKPDTVSRASDENGLAHFSVLALFAIKPSQRFIKASLYLLRKDPDRFLILCMSLCRQHLNYQNLYCQNRLYQNRALFYSMEYL